MAIPGIPSTRVSTIATKTPALSPQKSFQQALQSPTQVLPKDNFITQNLAPYLRQLVHQEQGLNQSIHQAVKHHDFAPSELIALQMKVYRYSETLTFASMVVEKVTHAIKQILTTQV